MKNEKKIIGLGLIFLTLTFIACSINQASYPLYLWQENKDLQYLSLEKSSPLEKEVGDPNTQYYGMMHRNTYGMPRNTTNKFSFVSYIKDLPNWLDYFPDLSDAFEKYKQYNPDKIKEKFTSTISMAFLENRKTYHVGEVYKVRLQAKDSFNENKQFGGDYFRARLLKVSLKGLQHKELNDGVPCGIEDHRDGSYTVEAILPFEGSFVLEIMLVASVEGIFRTHEWSVGRIHQSDVFHGILSSKEVVECGMDLALFDRFKDRSLCDYSNPRNGEPYYCGRPPSGTCFPIVFTEFINAKNEAPFDLLFELTHVHQHFKIINEPKHQIVVEPPSLKKLQGKTVNEFILSTTSIHQTGYGYLGRWVTMEHDHMFSSIKDYLPCFSNKVVYMFGDSTIKQLFKLIVPTFQLNLVMVKNDPSTFQPRLGRNTNKNITIYMRTHGLPFLNNGSPNVRPYITDSIEGIKVGGKDVVVIINLGLHLIQYDVHFYLHRLCGIKIAITRHLKKFPETKFIIKGMNVHYYPAKPQEWMVHRLDTILRETFKGLKNVVFVDLRDMTTLYRLNGDYHPVQPILQQQALLIFSYIP